MRFTEFPELAGSKRQNFTDNHGEPLTVFVALSVIVSWHNAEHQSGTHAHPCSGMTKQEWTEVMIRRRNSSRSVIVKVKAK